MIIVFLFRKRVMDIANDLFNRNSVKKKLFSEPEENNFKRRRIFPSAERKTCKLSEINPMPIIREEDETATDNFSDITGTQHQENNDCPYCGMPMKYCSKLCRNCYIIKAKDLVLLKPIKPSYEVLMEELKKMSYVAIGRKYGVSDTAVRKWIKNYKNQLQNN